MTFVVDAKGRIYEKDLGPTTVDQAKTMAAINLDSTWKRVSAEAEDDAQAVNEK
jgi:hypothetical protein